MQPVNQPRHMTDERNLINSRQRDRATDHYTSREGHPQDAPLRLMVRRGERRLQLVPATPAPGITRRRKLKWGYSTPATQNRSPGTPVYCNSLSTSCCCELACARAAMPVWLRISYFDMLELACA